MDASKWCQSAVQGSAGADGVAAGADPGAAGADELRCVVGGLYQPRLPLPPASVAEGRTGEQELPMQELPMALVAFEHFRSRALHLALLLLLLLLVLSLLLLLSSS